MEGTTYLVYGRNVKEGKVLICHDEQWYSMCGDSWSEAEADVVCSSLGYSAENGQEANYCNI